MKNSLPPGSELYVKLNKPSGKINLVDVILWLPFYAGITYLLSILYTYVLIINPFKILNLVVFLLFCLVIFITAIMCINTIRSRNIWFSMLAGSLLGLVAVYSSWAFLVTDIYATEFTEETDTLDLLLDPHTVWFGVGLIAEDGWYQIFGITPKGIFIWSIWVIELMSIVSASIAGAYTQTDSSVYCETCDKWADSETDILAFTHSNRQAMLKQFLSQNIRCLEDASAVSPDQKQFFSLDAEWCAECNGIHALTLNDVTRAWDSEGTESSEKEVLYEDMIVTKYFFDRVMDRKKTLKFTQAE